jgi:hypothetical protein
MLVFFSKKKKKKDSLEDNSKKSKGKSRQVHGDVESEDWDEDQISGVQETYVEILY